MEWDSSEVWKSGWTNWREPVEHNRVRHRKEARWELRMVQAGSEVCLGQGKASSASHDKFIRPHLQDQTVQYSFLMHIELELEKEQFFLFSNPFRNWRYSTPGIFEHSSIIVKVIWESLDLNNTISF